MPDNKSTRREKMRKIIFFAAITWVATFSVNASASISVTTFTLSGGTDSVTNTAGGMVYDDGNMGSLYSVDDLYTSPWTATQETAVITNSNGVTWKDDVNGYWDYSADIANMTDNQVAVGLLWNWNGNNGAAVLAVFDCTSGTECIGQTTGADGNAFGGIQNGAVVGPIISFDGTGTLTAVPLPATFWLMGAGLMGLVSIANRRRLA